MWIEEELEQLGLQLALSRVGRRPSHNHHPPSTALFLQHSAPLRTPAPAVVPLVHPRACVLLTADSFSSQGRLVKSCLFSKVLSDAPVPLLTVLNGSGLSFLAVPSPL